VWRTKKVRHGIIASGRFARVAVAGVGEEYQGWASGPTAVGACRDLCRRDAQRCGEDPGGVELQIIWEWVLRFKARRPDGQLNGNAAGQRAKLNDSRRQSIARMIKNGPIPMIHGVVRWWLAVRIQPYYDPTMVIVTAAH
jgi:hypothetical protein